MYKQERFYKGFTRLFSSFFSFIKTAFKFLRRYTYFISVAFMLGWSNSLKGETKTMEDTGIKIEQEDIIPDPDEDDGAEEISF